MVDERGSALATVSGRLSRGLRIAPVRNWSLVQIGAFAGTLAELQRCARLVLNADLPARVGTVVHAEGRLLLKTAAAQFWIIAPQDRDPTQSLLATVSPEVGSVTALSHSRVRIAIEGAAAADLLAMGVALDFHPSAFRVGQFALTGLHHTPVMIHRIGLKHFELYAQRTFAQSIWHWLTDAAELGRLNEQHFCRDE